MKRDRLKKDHGVTAQVGMAPNEPEPVAIRFNHFGAPVVHTAMVLRAGPGVVAIEVALGSKYCRVGATSSGTGPTAPGVFIEATDESLHLSPRYLLATETWIEFPEYPGWTVWCASIGRYTLSVCLVDLRAKEESHDPA